MYQEKKKIIVLDLDGVLCEETRRWDDFATRKPLPVRTLLLTLKQQGYTVIVSTARVGVEAFWDTVHWFELHNLACYVDEIRFNKPIAVAYIDDKGARSLQTFFDLMEEVNAEEKE